MGNLNPSLLSVIDVPCMIHLGKLTSLNLWGINAIDGNGTTKRDTPPQRYIQKKCLRKQTLT